MILKKVTTYRYERRPHQGGGFTEHTIPDKVTYYLFGIPVWTCTYINRYPLAEPEKAEPELPEQSGFSAMKKEFDFLVEHMTKNSINPEEDFTVSRTFVDGELEHIFTLKVEHITKNELK
jgi:hypothetical protein